MADELGEVTALLLKWGDVDILQGLCDEYQIAVQADLRGDQAHLRKLVLRYLNSETLEKSPDGGKAVFAKLLGELRAVAPPPLAEVGDVNKVPAEDNVKVKVENGPVVSDTTVKPASTPVVTESLSYQKLKAFKINGSIGAQGQKDTLSYTSLSFQIRQGETQRYSDNEIYSAVIQAIKPGNPLRDLLEAKGSPDKATLIKLLRSHYNEKDPGSVFQDLRHCVQMPGEAAHAFCCRAMALREKVKSLSAEEGRPFDSQLLNTTFFRAIFTGLKQNNIRMEIQHLLKGETCSDEDLLSEISIAAANEAERVTKSKSKVDVQKVSAGGGGEEPKNDKPNTTNAKKTPKSPAKPKSEHENLLASIREVCVKVDGFVGMKDQLEHLGAQVAQLQAQQPQPPATTGAWNFPFQPSYTNSSPRGRGRGRGRGGAYGYNPSRGRCHECFTQNIYCIHCFRCGSSDHKVQDCPN